MRYVHACRSKTKEKRGRTFGSQIVINEYTSFCRWTSPSPLPSVLSVKLLYYITSDDVKTGTPSELEPLSPEFISLLAEVARYHLLLSLSLVSLGETEIKKKRRGSL
ncbi:hypothetical protein F2Q68_00006875 [Brassica cretica]|uniref:Uncharacterized protein n=1 Tax=Brassica cretica TaxID=69181 RepID=A0A8S9JF48_BRACR|nr:hypothetical protein F2Q68_00006875 [Brassica cretica]